MKKTQNRYILNTLYKGINSLPKYFKKIVCLVSIILLSFQAFSYNIKGQIKDSKTLESIPYANVIIKNTTSGMMSDNNGNFNLSIDKFPCTIIIKFIGYESQEIHLKGEQEFLNVLLKEEVVSLNEITVRPDNYYERSLLRKIVKSRKKNNPDRFKSLHYQDYTRTTVFLSNLKLKTAESKTFRKSADAFVKSSDSTLMMPFYINETICKHNRIDNKSEKSITAEKSDGILPQVNPQIKSALDKKVTTEFNFYNNQINILTRGFPSPISSTALMYYNIYLSDSTVTNNVKHYKFNFFPKSYKNITFKGHFWVEEGSWALTEIKATLPNSANLNFVKDLQVHINYEKVDDNLWFYKTQKINLNLTISKREGKKRKKKNFDVQKLICYRDVNTNHLTSFPVNSISNRSFVDSEANNQKIIAFRQKVAPLDTFEQSAYQGIDKLKKNKFIKVADKFSAMTINGYYNLGKLDLGPYFSFYRRNEIEGKRLTLPLRTSEKLFKNFMLGGYLGYGFKNKDWAYGGNVKIKLPTPKRTILSLNYHYDYFDLTKNKFVEFIRENPYQQGGGNIVSSFTAKVPNPYLIRNRNVNVSYEHQLNQSIGILVRPAFNRYYSNYNLIFAKENQQLSHFDTYNLMLDTRFSFKQHYDEGFFSRIYYGNQKPVIHISTLLGKYHLPFKNGSKSGYYANINLSLKNRFNIGPMFIKSLIEVGGIVGRVPYPLLQLPRGTRDIGSARYHFNLLHHSSFVSDLYSSVHVSLNGGGVIFNKIPLIKALNLREIISFKSYYGKLLGNHDKVMEIPSMLRAPSKEPYMEMGFGITNILKCLRVEYVNRINKADRFKDFSSSHGIRFRIEVSF